MPRIIKTEHQNKALKCIRDDLKTVSGLTRFINNTDIKATVILANQENRISITQDKVILDVFAKTMRKSLIDRIKKLARDNAIELSPEDLSILDILMPKRNNDHEYSTEII